MKKSFQIGNVALELLLGDITEQHVDAIVNAANAHLAGGGGVDGAIHRKAGADIMKETKQKYPNGCPTGDAVVTGAGKLSAKFIFHAVGPRWHDGYSGEKQQLQNVYRRCLELADEKQCESIAFPSISTGAYGFPIKQAAETALQTIVEYINNKSKTFIKTIRFCLFSDSDFKVYENAIEILMSIKS